MQPSPGALTSQQVKILSQQQNTSIDDIMAQQQNFAKNYNNSTALSKYIGVLYLIDSVLCWCSRLITEGVENSNSHEEKPLPQPEGLRPGRPL